MARLTFNQQAERCLRLILGMRHPQVRDLLKPYGFNDAELVDGWKRMTALTAPADLSMVRMRMSEQDIAGLGEFVARWYPVARAVLRERYPEQERSLFDGVKVSRGRTTAMMADVFARRLEEMNRGDQPFGQDGCEAHGILVEHGLNQQEQDKLRALLARVWAPQTEPAELRTREQDQAAMANLWSWYLKWSTIARVVVQDKRLVLALGLLPRSSKQEPADEGNDEPSSTSITVVREESVPGDDSSQRLLTEAETDQ